jgi:hypothetical protein
MKFVQYADDGVRNLMHPQRQSNIQTKSAARLAAEAAFAPLSYPTEALTARSSPTISFTRVKRKAALALAELKAVEPKPGQATAPTDLTSSSPPQLPAPRARQVFLFRPVNAGLDSISSETRPLRLRKAKRNAPLPVTLLYSAAPVLAGSAGARLQQDAPVPQVHVQDVPPVLGSAHLAASLGEIEPAFATIKAAMGFEHEDPQSQAQSQAEWGRLSKALDQLAAELRALPPGPGARSGVHLKV